MHACASLEFSRARLRGSGKLANRSWHGALHLPMVYVDLVGLLDTSAGRARPTGILLLRMHAAGLAMMCCGALLTSAWKTCCNIDETFYAVIK